MHFQRGEGIGGRIAREKVGGWKEIEGVDEKERKGKKKKRGGNDRKRLKVGRKISAGGIRESTVSR